MSKKFVAYLQLHIAVILFGLTAILGDLISISAVPLVWWRVLIASVSLLFFIQLGRKLKELSPSTIRLFLGIGCIVGLHWMCFYGSIKLANASVALITMATTTFFTAIIEPILTPKKFSTYDMTVSVLIIVAMLFVAQTLDFSYLMGLLVGLLSALLASLFAILNKKYVDRASPYEISFLEMFGAFILISFIIPFLYMKGIEVVPHPTDWKYLLILALACTTFAFIISLLALRHVSAFEANLVINLEPVYGIILAIIILKEHKELSPSFYFGAALIMLLVFSHPVLKKYFTK